MRIPLFQLDAFATRLFSGNPAAVMPLPSFLPDPVLLAIAAENNLSETAFLVPEGEDYRLRWFTPANEVPLCGHATLASACVVMERLQPQRSRVVFHTASGALTVNREEDRYVMDFPACPAQPVACPGALAAALGVLPVELHDSDFNYLALLESAAAVRKLAPDMKALTGIPKGGVIVTAPADTDHDFVSRYFAPAEGVPEDPVTGSAHCMLAPFWAARLGRTDLRGFQASRRGGEVLCRVRGDRVELTGTCVFYLEGTVDIGDGLTPGRDSVAIATAR
jgi:PhzF family phenazine biosynthesis protein